MVVGVGGVRQSVSELLQVVCRKPLGICYGFATSLNLNFGFPKFGVVVSLWWWALVVSHRASLSCYRPSIQSHKGSVAVLP